MNGLLCLVSLYIEGLIKKFRTRFQNLGISLKISGFPERFQDFSQDFQRFQPEAYEISRSEQPFGLYTRPKELQVADSVGVVTEGTILLLFVL